MNRKIITIHQPQYLPWIPYFHKVLQSDIFVLLDDVQFQKNGVQNRNQIKTPQGVLWLTIPVKQSFGQRINEVDIANKNVFGKHKKTLELNYSKSPFYSEIMNLLTPIFDKDFGKLVEINNEIIIELLSYLEFRGEIILSSQLNINLEGSERILEICKSLGASMYISGSGGKDYLNLESFGEANIEVIFQDYKSFEYPQLYAQAGFVKDLSVIDLLFNVGKQSKAWITKRN